MEFAVESAEVAGSELGRQRGIKINHGLNTHRHGF